MRFAYIFQVHESMDTWNSIFCTRLLTRNTQLQDTKMLGGVKRKSEKEREEGMWETISNLEI